MNLTVLGERMSPYLKKSVLIILLYGISAGLPYMLIFSSLSLWLREAGIEKSVVTFFSWAALAYSFKFIWSPLVDRLPLPWLTKKMGRRRSWLFLSQFCLMLSVLVMALIDPSQSYSHVVAMAFATVALGFSGATQDIVIDAFRIESDKKTMQALLSSVYIAGYRLGMIISGAGALYLAEYFGSQMGNYSYEAWRWTYICMGVLFFLFLLMTLFVSEPKYTRPFVREYSDRDYSRLFALFILVVIAFIGFFISLKPMIEILSTQLVSFVGHVFTQFLSDAIRFLLAMLGALGSGLILVKLKMINQDMAIQTYVAPVRDFFNRYGVSVSLLLLSLVGLYRISDIVLGVIANLFYQDLGFDKTQIATAVKTFGVGMSILGGILGGIATIRWGVMRILFWGAFLSSLTNLLFMWLATMGNNELILYFVISADNLSGGLASAAFVAFLSSLTNVSFTAVQYALFTSLMTLLPKLMGGYSGTIVEGVGYKWFFLFTALIGVPVLFLVHWAQRCLEISGSE